jgi:hypothetical protein
MLSTDSPATISAADNDGSSIDEFELPYITRGSKRSKMYDASIDGTQGKHISMFLF